MPRAVRVMHAIMIMNKRMSMPYRTAPMKVKRTVKYTMEELLELAMTHAQDNLDDPPDDDAEVILYGILADGARQRVTSEVEVHIDWETDRRL
jgi:hypothetical protein